MPFIQPMTVRHALAVLCLALIGLTFRPAGAADIAFPPLTGRVVDEAGLLSPRSIERLDGELAAHEQRTGEQVVVAIVKSLQGRPIEDYGYQLGRAWGIGQKGKDNGAILLVAPTERKVRIEVGYGLEGDLTDAVSAAIINRAVVPRFRQGDMEGGVVAGAEQILRVLGDDLPAAGTPSPKARQQRQEDSPAAFLVTILVIAVLAWIMRRVRGGPGSALLPFFIADSWSSRSRGSFGGGFGGGGGGFSGGGGSFGGGGSSGSW